MSSAAADAAWDPASRALRESVWFADEDPVRALRIAGPGAERALAALCTCDLRLREGRIRPCLLLDERGAILADARLCRDADDWLLLVESLDPPALLAHVRNHATAAGATVEDLGESHSMLLLTGPWAWELLGEIVGPEVAGLPWGSFFRFAGWTAFRAGRTGEFSYEILAPPPALQEVRARLVELGARFDLVTAEPGPAALGILDRAMLEAGHFNVRREGRSGASPVELQLQWRLQRSRGFVGAEALAAERAAGGPARRLTSFVAAAEIAIGDPVHLDDRVIGQVVNADRSPARGGWIGTALLERALSHAGIDRFSAGQPASAVAIRTITPPFIQPRSLAVVPQTMRYAARAEYRFPPLA